MRVRRCSIPLLAGSLAALSLGVVTGCDEGGAEPAATAVQQEAAPSAPTRTGPQWGGNPALGPAKRSAQGLRDRIEGDQRQLADDIERGTVPVPE